MRKKSHISLARYLVESKGMEQLQSHKKAFYWGSIQPDCMPSFITRRHSIEDTFPILEKEIKKITENFDTDRGINRYFCRHLGVITHYIADYFTFPHNKIFPGNVKDHCQYESELKRALRIYVKTDDAKRIREKSGIFNSIDEILTFIKKMHQEYLNALKAVKQDCLYIVELCHKVVDAILQLFELQLNKISHTKNGYVSSIPLCD